MWSIFRRWRRRKLIQAPLLDSHRATITAYVSGYEGFRKETRRKLHDRVKVLIAERTWEGCDGLTVDDEMRVAIAAQAALMLLGTRDYYFDSISSILVFPDVIERYHDGVVSHVVGEAWDGGNVVLSWPEVQLLRDDRDGTNVVIHEFAHHLDGLDGEMGGSIHFPDRRDQRRWDEIAGREFDRLLRDLHAGRRTLLDPYAATNLAEFFAVASEAFFETPHKLRQRHPDLYELLTRFFAVDPGSL